MPDDLHAEWSGGDPVLTAEREQLRRSRDYLRLMREDVLSLEAMAGDRVSQEYLKAGLYHRADPGSRPGWSVNRCPARRVCIGRESCGCAR